MKKITYLLILFFLAVPLLYFSQSDTSAKSNSEPEPLIIEQPEVEVKTEEYTIEENDTFIKAMEVLMVSYTDALSILDASADVFDFTKIRAGKMFRLVYEDNVRSRIEYEGNTETLVIIDLQNNFNTYERPIEYDIDIEKVEVIITDSLFLSGIEANLPETLLLKFVDIFAWEVDFATQVQTGDSFTILYEKRMRNGKEAKEGNIIFGSFSNTGEVTNAYRFVDSQNVIGYYNESGDSLIRPFLKAPLDYSRISSGYTTARFHPVLERTTPHRAIDYAAPYGTPIKAVSDGVITFAGWNGGYGNLVDIRHNGVYETQYAHLSRIVVKRNEQVQQGKIIGYVGSTGFSTGPHLHYQIKINGQLTNPLEVDFPKGESITEIELTLFSDQKNTIDRLL